MVAQSTPELYCTKKILESEAGQVCRTENKGQTTRLVFTSSGMGPPVFLEKSGFPEEAFLPRVWYHEQDMMTRSPLPWPKTG